MLGVVDKMRKGDSETEKYLEDCGTELGRTLRFTRVLNVGLCKINSEIVDVVDGGRDGEVI